MRAPPPAGAVDERGIPTVPEASSPTPPEPRFAALATNAGAMIGARYAVAALGWLGTIIMVRRLSVAEFGRFTFVFSLIGMVAVFTELGLGRMAIKGLVDDGRDKAAFAGTLVALRTCLGLVVYGLAVAFVVVAGYPPEVVRATLVAGVVLLLATPSHAIEVVFQVHLRMGTVALSRVVGQLAQLGLIAAIAVGGGGSVVLFAVPPVAGEVLILAWRVVTVRKLQTIRLNVDWAEWWVLLREAAPLAAGAIMVSFSYRLDSVMLSKLDTFDAVGVYGVAYKFVDIVHYLPSALMPPLLAVLVRAWPDDPRTFAHNFRRAFTALALLGTLVAVQFTVFARPVISLLYGSQYAEGAQAARIVVGAECVAAFSVLALTVLVAMGRNRLYPVAAVVGLVVNIALNLWLIPTRSYEGAAAATLVTNILVVVVMWISVSRLDVLRPLPLQSLALAGLGGGIATAVAAGTWAVLPWPVASAAAAVAFVGFTGLVSAMGRRKRLGEAAPLVPKADRSRQKVTLPC
jgi:O-antigen/teichoic acid export membrane protein